MKERMPKKEKLKDKVAKIKEKKAQIKEKIKKNGKKPEGKKPADNTASSLAARRLATTYTVTIEPTTDGADVVAYGNESGVENMNLSILYSSLLAMFYVLLQ